MDNSLKIVVLSALLHDIGKFAQRAKRPYSKEMQETYLKNSGYWHTLYTDYFIENDFPLPAYLEVDRGKIARIASAHHRPDEENLSEMAIALGDRLSAGTDRIEYHEADDSIGFRESRLLSIFDEVELVNHNFEEPGNWYHKLISLEAESDAIFPVKSASTGRPEDYDELFDVFLKALGNIDTTLPFALYHDSLVSLLEKYTWSIPSSAYETLPDISLFDHSLTTATIAQALYLFHAETETVPGQTDHEKKFILLGGDLSGIQDYIFGISKNSGRGVSKIFRARSFYLQALVKSVVISIQNHLGLLPVCRVMDAGGKFVLLLPKLDYVQAKLSKLDHNVQSWFRKKFKGLLTLNLAWNTCLGQKDFQISQFQAKLDNVNESIELSKYSKLKKTIAVDGPIIRGDYDEMEGGNCVICGVNRMDEKSTGRYRELSDVDTAVCHDCYQQIEYIGTNLPQTDYHVYGQSGHVKLFDDIWLSVSNKSPSDYKSIYHIETFSDDVGFTRARFARHMPKITSQELMDEKWFKLFEKEAEDVELKEDQPKTFNMIALKSKKMLGEDLIGRSLLGFMKADVDNLGFIFGLGLGDRLSIARFSFLSRMLNLFFSDYLVELVRHDFPDIYVVFAGGDDLFIVGPWHQTIRFAIRLRQDFSRFCAENEDITLSAGVLIGKPRFPMRRAAEDVEKLLDESKKHKVNGKGKNAITLLDRTLSWSDLDELLKLGERFDRALGEKDRTNFSMAFMYRLLEYYRMYGNFINKGEIGAGRYLSHAHYDIGRNIMDAKKDNQQELEMLWDIFAVGGIQKPLLEKLYIPLFYAINLNRKEN